MPRHSRVLKIPPVAGSNEFPIPAELLPGALGDAELLADVIFDNTSGACTLVLEMLTPYSRVRQLLAPKASSCAGECGRDSLEAGKAATSVARLEWEECHKNSRDCSDLGGDSIRCGAAALAHTTCDQGGVGGDDEDSWWHDEATLRAADELELAATASLSAAQSPGLAQ